MLTTPKSQYIWVDAKGFTSAPNTTAFCFQYYCSRWEMRHFWCQKSKFPRCCCLPLACKVWFTSYASSGNIAAKARSLFSIRKTLPAFVAF